MSASAVESEYRRNVRYAELGNDSFALARAIDDIYEDRLDLALLRGALPAEPLSAAGTLLAQENPSRSWSRPNVVAPAQDIYILGTDAPATPTYSAPTGATLDAYLSGARRHGTDTEGVFPAGFDAIRAIEDVLGRVAGGRTVELARSADGRPFTPYTLRLLGDGKQIGLHHDYHYRLAMYEDLARRLDTATLVSWVFTLRPPSDGGELVVYGLTPDDPDIPKNARGWPDLDRVNDRYDHESVATASGDLFLLAAGRCYHRVTPVSGAPRVTMGGFLAFDTTRERVFYWS